MDLNYIRKLVKLVDSSGVDEIEIEEEGTKVRISKHHQNSSTQTAVLIDNPRQSAVPQGVLDPLGSAGPEVASGQARPQSSQENKYHEVRSPIVGTFYRAPAPNAEPYVEVGSVIQPGSILCIIEAMKLMNEIESDIGGKVVKVLVENGRPVEYNQPLFEIEPA